MFKKKQEENQKNIKYLRPARLLRSESPDATRRHETPRDVVHTLFSAEFEE